MEATIDTTEARRWKRYEEYQATDIPWHEKIPSHWEVVRFKYRIGFQEGPGIMASDFRMDGIPLLRIRNITIGNVRLEGCNFLDPEKVASKWSHFRVKEGDLLISCSATTGIVSSVGRDTAGSVPYTGIIRLWPKDDRTIPDFIRFLVVSEGYKGQIDLQKTGSTIQHYGPIHLGRIYSAFPPIEEQKAIARFLRREVARIDALVGGVQITSAKPESCIARKVELFREYRSALISAAVTGQIDVREEVVD